MLLHRRGPRVPTQPKIPRKKLRNVADVAEFFQQPDFVNQRPRSLHGYRIELRKVDSSGSLRHSSTVYTNKRSSSSLSVRAVISAAVAADAWMLSIYAPSHA